MGIMVQLSTKNVDKSVTFYTCPQKNVDNLKISISCPRKVWYNSNVLNLLGGVKLSDNTLYEYDSKSKLDGNDGVYFRIPKEVIVNNDSNDMLITTFMFFAVRRGLDDKVMFNVNWMVKWHGKNSDRHSRGINSKFASAVNDLCDLGYLSLDGGIENTKMYIAEFNTKKVKDECDTDYFAIIYLDEYEKIMEYDTKSKYVNNDILLRVYAYLKMNIRNRSNRLSNEDACQENPVESRRAKKPEVMNMFYRDEAEEIGISERAMSQAVKVLHELGLLYYEPLPRVKVDGKWRTNHTLVCNMYKRENGYLMTCGENYYMREISNKKKLLMKIGMIQNA